MPSGWKFTVTVPSWTQATLEADELVVFYKVEVKVIPPQGGSFPKMRSVLRRYNHFVKLHNKLCTELGNPKMAGKDPPAKRLLFNINRRPELIERRKKELQQWLWRLISDPEISKAKALNDFLELGDAARLVQRPIPFGSAAEPPESVVDGSYGMSEGSSPRGDASSEISGFTTASQVTDMGTPSRGQQPTAEFAAETDAARSRPPRSRPAAAASSFLESVLEGEENGKRLGLRIEQRASLRRLVKNLKQMLDIASSDLQDAVEALHTEREAKRHLAEKVGSLEQRVNANHSQREAELERLLNQERSSSNALEQALAEATSNRDELLAELEGFRRQAAPADELQASKESAVEEATARLEAAHKAEIDRLAQQHAETLGRAENAEARAQEATARTEAAREEVRLAQETVESAKSKTKADMKLLAKEVKSLRKQLAEAVHRAEKAETEAVAAVAQVRSDGTSKRDIEALEQRLGEAVERAEAAELAAAEAVERARPAEEARSAGQSQSMKSLADAESRAQTATAQLASMERQLREEHMEALTKALADAEAQRQSNVAAAAKKAQADASDRVAKAESRAREAVTRLAALDELWQRDAASRSEAEAEGQSARKEAAAELERVKAEGAARLRDAEARAAETEAILGSLLEQQGRDAEARREAEAGLREVRDQLQAAQRQATTASDQLQAAKSRAEGAEARLSAAQAEWEQRVAELSAQLAQARTEAQEAERRRERLATAARSETGRVGLVQLDASKPTAREESLEALDSGGGQPSNTVAARGPSAEQQAPPGSQAGRSQAPSAPGSETDMSPKDKTAAADVSGGRDPESQGGGGESSEQTSRTHLVAPQSEDPFAVSGSLDLFSGLTLTGPAKPLSSSPPEGTRLRSDERLAPTVDDFEASGSATVARSESGGGLDLLDMEDDMLVEATLRSEGCSSCALSWASDGAGKPPEIPGGLQEPLHQLSRLPEASAAQSGMPHPKGKGEAPGVLHPGGGPAAEGQVSPGPRDESASDSGIAPEGAKPTGLFGRLISPAAGTAGGQQAAPAGSRPRGMGSIMNRIGVGAQPGNPAPQAGQAGPQAQAAGRPLQAVWGRRDQIESFAKGLIRKSGARQDG